MKNHYLKYFLAVVLAMSCTCVTGVLNANQDDQIVLGQVEAPQVLQDFVVQAMSQGLPVDAIVQQGLAFGYSKEEIVAAYVAVVSQDDNESMSTQEMVMWGVLGTAAVVAIGVGSWYLYKWLTNEGQPAIAPQGNGRQPQQIVPDQDDGELRVRVLRLEMVEANGAVLPGDGNQRINQHIEQGLAAGRNHQDLIREVRQMFPDHAFRVGVDREIEDNRMFARGQFNERFAPWNNDPFRDGNLANLFADDGAQPLPGLQPNQVLVAQENVGIPGQGGIEQLGVLLAHDADNPIRNVFVRLEMRPDAGFVLHDNDQQQIDQVIQEAIAAGRENLDIINQVRGMFPNHAFRLGIQRELRRGDRVVGRQNENGNFPPLNFREQLRNRNRQNV